MSYMCVLKNSTTFLLFLATNHIYMTFDSNHTHDMLCTKLHVYVTKVTKSPISVLQKINLYFNVFSAKLH